MCHAVPVKVTEVLPDDLVRVDFAGVAKVISAVLVDDVAVGDWVIVHVGYALAKMDTEEAERTLDLLAELGGLPGPQSQEPAP